MSKPNILFLDEIPRGRPIYLYGAGGNGRALRVALAAAQFDELVAFIDTNMSGVVDGLTCLKLSDYLSRRSEQDLILLASSYAAEIDADLMQHGILDAMDASHVFSVLLHHELASEERFLRLYQPPGVAFDIGANAGFVARLLRRRASEVHVFEPNRAMHAALDRNFAGRDGFRIVHHAVSDYEGEARFHISSDANYTGSSLLADPGRHTISLRVQVTTIDAYCAVTGVVPRTIKIDVESVEPAVIRGGWNTITQHRPLLLLEFQEAADATDYREMLARLSELYRVVRVPWLDDPAFSDGYVDAVDYYRTRSPAGGVTNLGCLPL